MSLFSNMVKKWIKVFIHDFQCMGDSYDQCISLREGYPNMRVNVLSDTVCYRKGIKVEKGFGTLAKPLSSLLQHDIALEWTDLCESAFQALKEALTSTALCNHQIDLLWFELMCDASDVAIIAVVGQRKDNTPYAIRYEEDKIGMNDLKETLFETWYSSIYHPKE